MLNTSKCIAEWSSSLKSNFLGLGGSTLRMYAGALPGPSPAPGGTITLIAVELALYSTVPQLGEIDPPGEVSYAGYQRVWAWFSDGRNEEPFEFPASEQDEPVFVAAVVAFDLNHKVVGVERVG